MGALQSSYILTSFAHHLAAIQGSRVREEDTLPARGALALAATAVSRATHASAMFLQPHHITQVQYVFTTWKTGIHNTKMPFKSDLYRDVTAYWHDKAVVKMIERGRYDKYVKIAEGHIESSWVALRTSLDYDDDVSVCDPSSSDEGGEGDVFS